jgi:hypothetical protein
MDKKGNCLKKIELSDTVIVQVDENNEKYFFSGNAFERNVFFLKASPIYRYVSRSFKIPVYDEKKAFELSPELLYTIRDSFLLQTDYDRLYNGTIKHKNHSLLKYDIQTGQYQYALSTMWRTICPDTNLYLRDMDFVLENNILFVYSRTGDLLYLLNKNTYKIDKKIKIASSYTDIGFPPCSKKDLIEGYYEKNIPLHGQLLNILYDKYNHLYYVFIRHSVNDPFLINQAYIRHSVNDPFFIDGSSFSIQIYNKKFKKLAEQIFDGKEYTPNHYIICSQGLLLRNNSSQMLYDDSVKIKYDLYRIKQ